MSHSPTIKILANGPDYCRIPSEFNPNEHQCSDGMSIGLALFVLILVCLLIPPAGLLLRRRKEALRNRPWNPLNGALWGAVYILLTMVNALTVGSSASAALKLQFFQLLLTVPRLGQSEFGVHMFTIKLGEKYKKAAADGIVAEAAIGTVSLGFMIHMFRMMVDCGGMSAMVKTSAFLLPALGLASSLWGLAVTSLITARQEVKKLWILPSLALALALAVSSLVFWFRLQDITPQADCPDGWVFTPQMTLQIFLPSILGFVRLFMSCAVWGGSFAQPSPVADDRPASYGEDPWTTPTQNIELLCRNTKSP